MLKKVLIVLLTLSLVWVSYILYNVVEFYEYEVNSGWQNKAKKNPYLALERLAKRNDQALLIVDSFQKLEISSEHNFIYIADIKVLPSENRIDELFDWVKDGGKLLVGLSHYDNIYTNDFLQRLNLTKNVKSSDKEKDAIFNTSSQEENANNNSSQDNSSQDGASQDSTGRGNKSPADKPADNNKNESLNEKKEQFRKNFQEGYRKGLEASKDNNGTDDRQKLQTTQERIAAQENEILSSYVTFLNVPTFDGPEWLNIYFNSNINLYHPDMQQDSSLLSDYVLKNWQGIENETYFVELQVGAGLVSVMSDNGLFNSNSIALFDHAYFWQLISDSHAVVIYGSNMAPLSQILWRVMPETIIAAIGLLVLWLWAIWGHFGPKISIQHQMRRSFKEHIEADAGYLWRHQYYEKLLQPLRSEILAMADAKIMRFDLANQQQKITLISAQIDIDKNLIAQALFDKKPTNEEAFTQWVTILQRLRGHL